MHNYSSEIKTRLDIEEKYRDRLFTGAYLLSDKVIPKQNDYPFYNQWKLSTFNQYQLITHPLLNVYQKSINDYSIFLVGHAYNPFSDEIDEEIIADELLGCYAKNRELFFDKLDELTGVFVIIIISSQEVFAVQDPGGQRLLYFGKVNNSLIVTSVPQLIEDLYGIHRDEDVLRLLSSKGYYRGSGFLPGNKSPYRELKRLGPNTYLRINNRAFQINRFFPRNDRVELQSETDKESVINRMHDIFSKNIELSLKKWKKVGLSLTGGMDSKTTFANAKPCYSQLYVFSYISKESERIDAEAAKRICDSVNVEHHLYNIPEQSDRIEDYEFLQKIIEHNTSYTCKLHPNEKRKYIWLQRCNDFDVEMKSDISEIGRAYTNRKFYKVKMPRKLRPRHLTIGQARYFLEPWCMKYADNSYQEFMDDTGLTDDIFGYSMHDLAYWEVRMGLWASTSLASQEYIHDITIPYNNRKLLELFLSFPETDRLQDIPHQRLMDIGNPVVRFANPPFKDSYFDKKRMMVETAYYYYATRFIYNKK